MSLANIFARARAENRAALIGYLPAGFPTMEQSLDLVKAMVKGGCDIVEVGVPFSDPVMDGSVIEAASRQALAQGVRIPEVLQVVETIAHAGAAPLVMSYFNPILSFGIEKFSAQLRDHGGLGMITPDLIVDEACDWIQAAEEYDLDRIFLVAPSSTTQRLQLTVGACSGFVYAASTMGVTGTRATVDSSAQNLVTRIRELSDIPVSVGLGVRDRIQAREISSYADGVIVGSSFVTLASEGAYRVRELAESLALGVRGI